jgi:hypothetical protein
MSSSRPHGSVWKRLLLVFVILLVIVASMIGYSIFYTWRLIPESYAAWTTGNLMVEYLQTHTNQWPHSWENLRSATNSLQQKGMPVYVSLDRLPEFVKIDWRADVAHLQQVARGDSNATVQVITRLDGSRLRVVWGSDTEPNRKIMLYLQKQ